jgi:NAD(P)-dependent dehydrogenase (short-subunit alcohol dehydrogenase family)
MAKKMMGKVALISGGSGPKGLASAKLLVREGAHVVISDVKEEAGRSHAESLGDAAEFILLDVTNEDAWAAALCQIRDKHGRIDLLINNARTYTRNPDLSTFTLESWRAHTAVNLDGAFLGIKHCLPLMREIGGGVIINVVSLDAVAPFAPFPAYSASQAGLFNLTKTTAVNCARARANIRVNAVVCGMSANSPVDGIMDAAQRLIPLGRPAYAEDIAEAVLWLASDDSRYVTGSSVTLDGGYTAEGYAGI